MIYDRIQRLVGDRQRRFGNLTYDAGPPARFAIHFDRLLVDQRLDRDERWYIFDGRWLVERYDQEKLMIKRETAPPDADQPADPLALGSGPFALPVTLKKDVVLKRFDVSLIDPTKDDPPNSVHLRLSPKPTQPDDVYPVNLWYDRQTLLPVRVQTVDDSDNETLIQLNQLRANDPIDPATIDTSPPTDPSWRVEVKPWRAGP